MLTGIGLAPGPVEAGLHVVSLLRVCYVVLQAGHIGAILDVAALCLLAMGTAWLDVRLRHFNKSVGLGFVARDCPESGLMQGMLAVPTLMAAVAAATSRGTWLLLYRCSVASSLQMLALLLWRYSHTCPTQDNPQTSIIPLPSQPAAPALPTSLDENTRITHPSTSPSKSVSLAGKDAEIVSLMQQVLCKESLRPNVTISSPQHQKSSPPLSPPTSSPNSPHKAKSAKTPPPSAPLPLSAANAAPHPPPDTPPPLAYINPPTPQSPTLTSQTSHQSPCPYAKLGSVACLVSATAFTLSSAILATSAIPTPTNSSDSSSSSAPFTAAAQLPPALRITCAVAVSLLCSMPGYAMLMTALPRSFTLGEGAIVAQGALLLAACSSSYLIAGTRLGPSHLLWSLHVAQPDPGMQVPAFVLLVPFWACALAGCCCLVKCPPSLFFSARNNTRSHANQHIKSPTAATLHQSQDQSISTHNSQASQHTKQSREQPLPSHQEQQQQQAPHQQHVQQQEQQQQQQPQHGALMLRAVGYGGGVVCCIMILDLAAWVLRRFIAASTAPRLATLAYWACVMATVVPFMMFLSQHNRRWWARKQASAALNLSGSLAAPVPLNRVDTSRSIYQEVGAVANTVSEVGESGALSALGSDSVASSGTRMSFGAGQVPVNRRRQNADNNPQPQLETHQGSSKCTTRAAPTSKLHPNSSCTNDADAVNISPQDSKPSPPPTPPSTSTSQTRQHPPLTPLIKSLLPVWFHVPHIIMRKGYHLLALALFVPAFAWDVRMLQASLAIAFAALVAAEALRCCNIPHVSPALQRFMADFADARDVGPLYITHFTLLLGMALPVWLSDRVCGATPSGCYSLPPLLQPGLQPDWATAADLDTLLSTATGSISSSGSSFGMTSLWEGILSPYMGAAITWVGAAISSTIGGSGSSSSCGHGGSSSSSNGLSDTALQQHFVCSGLVGLCGLVALGMGDTAASCVGFLIGRRRLFVGSRKTVEGTSAAAVAMMASWVWVVWWLGLGQSVSWQQWGALASITAGAALLEAVTQQLDNLVVPIYYVAHVALLFA